MPRGGSSTVIMQRVGYLRCLRRPRRAGAPPNRRGSTVHCGRQQQETRIPKRLMSPSVTAIWPSEPVPPRSRIQYKLLIGGLGRERKRRPVGEASIQDLGISGV